MTDLELRAARVDDAEGVARVHVRSWRAYRGLLPDDVLDGLSVDDRARRWRTTFDEPLPTSLGTLVALRDGRVVGWTSFGSGRDDDGAEDGEVYGIYADPDEWSTGVGRTLLQAAARRLAAAGHRRAYLWVLDGNDRADAFYARNGWVADGARKIDERGWASLAEHRRVTDLRD